MNTLREWGECVAAELGLPQEGDYQETVLETTGHVAHSVARPAAPLTAYLLGIAVGRGSDLASATATVNRLAAEWSGRTDAEAPR